LVDELYEKYDWFMIDILGFPYMGYSNRWMAYDGKSQSKMDALGVPPFQETSIIIYGTMDVPGKQMMFWCVFFL